MQISFRAAAVSASPIKGVLTVAILEHQSGEGKYLLLQRSEHESPQDRDLGLSGDYVELCSQSHTAYRGLESITIDPEKLIFKFNATGTRLLKAEQASIVHQLSIPDLQLVQAMLRKIVGKERIRSTIDPGADALSQDEVSNLVRIEGEAPDAYGELDLFVPAFKRRIRVHIELRDHRGISEQSAKVIADIMTMDAGTRSRINGLLYEHAIKSRDATLPSGGGILQRLSRFRAQRRLASLNINDWRHPAYFENGVDSVDEKVDWLEFRIDERARVKNRLCVLACRAEWEREQGISLIFRNGAPIGACDEDARVEDFDEA